MDKEEIITSLTEHRVKQEILIKSVEKLTKTVENGFNNLNCGKNEAKLNEVYLWHQGVRELAKKAKVTGIGVLITGAIGWVGMLIKEGIK